MDARSRGVRRRYVALPSGGNQFYKEKGVWKQEMDRRNRSFLRSILEYAMR